MVVCFRFDNGLYWIWMDERNEGLFIRDRYPYLCQDNAQNLHTVHPFVRLSKL